MIRDADPSADILCRGGDRWRGGRQNELADAPNQSEKRKSEIATASPVRVQCQQRWVMLLTLNVRLHLNFFFGSYGSRFRVEVHFTYRWLGLVIHICLSDEIWNGSIPFLSILLLSISLMKTTATHFSILNAVIDERHDEAFEISETPFISS